MAVLSHPINVRIASFPAAARGEVCSRHIALEVSKVGPYHSGLACTMDLESTVAWALPAYLR